MITVTSNISEAVAKLRGALEALKNPDPLLRTVATSMLPVVHDRIHVEGKAADGSPIGSYSNSYLRLREKKGRLEGKKVVLSFNRDQENDFSVQISSDGKYGLGYKFPINAQKAEWEEKRFGKKIFGLTDPEKELVNKVAQQYVEDLLSGIS